MTMDQIEGIEPIHENWGLNLGQELDDEGDPPRIWSPDGNYPGTAFTRSIGDAMAETLGVVADPELDEHAIRPEDRFIVIASDGVFEFLTNQAVVDMVAKHTCPLEASRAVVTEAYQMWLQYEVRTDDITMICLFVTGNTTTAAGSSIATQVGELFLLICIAERALTVLMFLTDLVLTVLFLTDLVLYCTDISYCTNISY
jgi:hypothetical protein